MQVLSSDLCVQIYSIRNVFIKKYDFSKGVIFATAFRKRKTYSPDIRRFAKNTLLNFQDIGQLHSGRKSHNVYDYVECTRAEEIKVLFLAL